MRKRLAFCKCGKICDSNCKQPRSQHNQTNKQRGYGWDWEQLSKSFRADNPLCWRCLEQGKTTPTAHAHHIIPIKQDRSRRLDRDNLAALCKPCHVIVEQETQQGKPYGAVTT